LQEFSNINKLCELIGRPRLFKQDFLEQKPKGFGLLIRPTRRSYLEFAHTLDKLLSENLNRSFFGADGLGLEEEISRRDGRVQEVPKGTIQLLEEWLALRIRFTVQGAPAQIVAPFRTIRKLRQNPAHRILEDEFSSEYQRKKELLISDIYTSISNIRALFQSHPRAKNYKFPKELNPKDVVLF
jgi:hypothetical protein